MLVCERCGESNPEGFGFCGFCGAALAGESPAREVRKTVTVLFSDVTGSTSLGERIDPESLRRVMVRYFEGARAAIEHHGGTVEKFIGDAVMAVFGIPRVHEDDALRALRAASDVRDALDGLNKELERDWGVTIECRMGVNTGEVVAGNPGSGQTLVTGDAVNVAARLEQAAPPGEILFGEETFRLVRDAVDAVPVEPISVKGKEAPVQARRLVRVLPDTAGVARRFDAPFVGRERELRLLRDAFERSTQDTACVLVTVLGVAGIGKSRLVEELLGPPGLGATVLRGRCLPYGDGITYWPIREMVSSAAGLEVTDDPDGTRARIAALVDDEADGSTVVERVAQLLGVEGASGSAQETFWAVRRLLEAMSRRNRLVVVVEDVQWAEPTLLDLLEHVADWARDAPMLLLCCARPELLDERPGWGGGKLNATSFLLEPVSPSEGERIVANLLGGPAPPESILAPVVAGAEGNPLFLEQLVAMLLDDETIVRTEDGWAASDLSAMAVPASIHSLIAARLDRLSSAQRSVLEYAAVEGTTFHRGTVEDLVPASEGVDVDDALRELVRRDLIRPARSAFPGDDGFRFRTILMRDLAYDGTPKETRADFHARFADRLRRIAGDHFAEYEEIVAYHLEQAYLLRGELGPPSEATRLIADSAAGHLAAAGHRASLRGDAAAATNLLTRSTALLTPDAPDRGELLIELGRSLVDWGDLPGAERVLNEALERARSSDAPVLEARAAIALLWLGWKIDPAGHRQGDDLARCLQLLPTLEGAGDQRALAEAWLLVGASHFWLGRASAAEEGLRRAVDFAREAGDERIQVLALGFAAGVVEAGPTPADRGIRRITGILDELRDRPSAQAFGLLFVGSLVAKTGRIEQGRATIADARARLEELGQRVDSAGAQLFAGEVELLAGDPDAAERHFRAGVEALESYGERGYLSTLNGALAEALAELGRDAESDRCAEKAERDTSADDFVSMIYTRRVRALLLARKGAAEEAERLAREAVEIADGTEWTAIRADSYRRLGEVLLLAGRNGEAEAAMHRALDLYDAKGVVMEADRIREWLDRPSGRNESST